RNALNHASADVKECQFGIRNIIRNRETDNTLVSRVSGDDVDRTILLRIDNAVAEAELTLFDLSGRMVQRIPLTRLSSGAEYYQPLDMPEGNGLYVVRLTAGTYTAAAKFTR
nr:T9SS type A sorting domain-containing protein [Elusimicrobiaceae bacterium]